MIDIDEVGAPVPICSTDCEDRALKSGFDLPRVVSVPERVRVLRDELRGLDMRLVDSIREIEDTLRSWQLGVPIEFAGYFTWQKYRGDWALWFPCPRSGEMQRVDSASRSRRADFIAWLGSDLEKHVGDSLEELIALRKLSLALDTDSGE